MQTVGVVIIQVAVMIVQAQDVQAQNTVIVTVATVHPDVHWITYMLIHQLDVVVIMANAGRVMRCIFLQNILDQIVHLRSISR